MILKKLDMTLTIIQCLKCLATGRLATILKKKLLNWAWELLTEKLKIDKDRLYVTVFEGDEEELLECDHEVIRLLGN